MHNFLAVNKSRNRESFGTAGFQKILVVIAFHVQLEIFGKSIQVHLVFPNAPHIAVIFLKVLQLLVQKHEVQQHFVTLKPLDVNFVLSYVFLVPFEHRIDVEFV